MRARMGLAYAGVVFEVREVLLKNKPQAMKDLSPKETVPVLLQTNQTILEESLDILQWALTQNDPLGWRTFSSEILSEIDGLIGENDLDFKFHLDHYKYSTRHPDHSQEEYRTKAEVFLKKLENRLTHSSFFFGDHISYADIAIFPFIRQFSKVDEIWFQSASYPKLQKWLNFHLDSELFLSIMKKYKPWKPDDTKIVFAMD